MAAVTAIDASVRAQGAPAGADASLGTGSSDPLAGADHPPGCAHCAARQAGGSVRGAAWMPAATAGAVGLHWAARHGLIGQAAAVLVPTAGSAPAAGARPLAARSPAHIGRVALRMAATTTVIAGGWTGLTTLLNRSLPREDPSPQRDASFGQAIGELQATTAGAGIAGYLEDNRARINLLPSDRYEEALPAFSAGAYLPRSRQVYVREEYVAMPAVGALLLAHEGQHMRYNSNTPTMFARSGANMALGMLDGVRAGLRGENPVTGAVEGYRMRHWITDEALAYHLEASIAHEMGVRTFSLPVQDAQGRPRSLDEIAEVVAAREGYQFRGAQRLAMSSALGLAGGYLGVGAITGTARRVAPGSVIARRPSLVSAAATALVGAAVVADQRANGSRRR